MGGRGFCVSFFYLKEGRGWKEGGILLIYIKEKFEVRL